MKKTYMKPELFAESFELVEHISACSLLHSAIGASDPNQGCGYSLNGPDYGTGDPILFLTNISEICTDLGDLSLVDSGAICYNYFMDEGTLMFGS